MALHGRRARLCTLRCGRRGVGSQAFYDAKAFNENIGSWNTAAVTTMAYVRALLPSRTTDVLFAAVVPAASGPGADVGMARLGCGRVPVQMWASRGADVGEAWLSCERVLCILSVNGSSLQRGCATKHHPLHRCILQDDVGASGMAGALGFVHCAVDGCGVGSQAFYGASAFNQNIGSWNTAAVSNMAEACALLPSHACGAQPTSFSKQWSRPQVVPGADVGMGPPRMWASPGADVGVFRCR